VLLQYHHKLDAVPEPGACLHLAVPYMQTASAIVLLNYFTVMVVMAEDDLSKQ